MKRIKCPKCGETNVISPVKSGVKCHFCQKRYKSYINESDTIIQYIHILRFIIISIIFIATIFFIDPIMYIYDLICLHLSEKLVRIIFTIVIIEIYFVICNIISYIMITSES